MTKFIRTYVSGYLTYIQTFNKTYNNCTFKYMFKHAVLLQPFADTLTTPTEYHEIRYCKSFVNQSYTCN